MLCAFIFWDHTHTFADGFALLRSRCLECGTPWRLRVPFAHARRRPDRDAAEAELRDVVNACCVVGPGPRPNPGYFESG